jgi:hypothetical protein
VENLIAEYAERIDAGDFDGVADLLAGAAVGADTGAGAGDADEIDTSMQLRGRDNIRRLYESTTRRYEDGTPRTRHVTTNLWIEVDEESGTAMSRSSYAVFQQLPGTPLQCILIGRYRDRFELYQGRWRFSQRLFTTDLVGDLSRHLLDSSYIEDA